MKLTRQVALVCLAAAFSAAACWGQQMGFGGPSILSGEGSPLGRTTGGAPLGLRPFVGLNLRYDSSLGEVPLGQVAPKNRYGFNGNWGLYGVVRGPRYVVGIDYQGSYRQYAGDGARNGANHLGNVSYVQQVGPATDIFFAGGVSLFKYGLLSSRTPLLLDVLPDVADPIDQVFDSSTKSYRASVGVSHMLSERWSLRLSGNGFQIKRANNLINTRGGSGTASINHPIAHNKSIGVSYTYNYFFYPNNYGSSNIHNVALNYNHQFSPNWHFTAAMGALRAENDRLVQVFLDPEIAALTGQKAALETTHLISYRPTFSFMLGRQFERSNLSLFYKRSARPGNGFITSSIRENWGAMYGYTATEKLHASVNFTASSHKAIAQDVGRYTTLGGGGGISYRLFSIVHFTAHVDARHWVVAGSALRRDRVGAMVGLTLSPGDVPLSIW